MSLVISMAINGQVIIHGVDASPVLYMDTSWGFWEQGTILCTSLHSLQAQHRAAAALHHCYQVLVTMAGAKQCLKTRSCNGVVQCVCVGHK